MAANIAAGSIHCMMSSEEEMLGPIHHGMERGRRGYAGALLEHAPVGHSGDGREDHVPPVGERLRAVIEMRGAENQAGGEQRAPSRAESQHQQVLDERAEENLFG